MNVREELVSEAREVIAKESKTDAASEPEDGIDSASADHGEDESTDDGEDNQSSKKRKFMTFDEIQRERRLALNRASARDRRKRKKDIMETLSVQVADITKKLSTSEAENKSLRARLAQLESALKQAEMTVATLSRQSPSLASSVRSMVPHSSVLEGRAIEHLMRGSHGASGASGVGLLGGMHSVIDSERAAGLDVQRILAHQQALSLSGTGSMRPHSVRDEPHDPILRAMQALKSRESNSYGMQRLLDGGNASALGGLSRSSAAGISAGSSGLSGSTHFDAYTSLLRQQALQSAAPGREYLDNALLSFLSSSNERIKETRHLGEE